MMPRDKYKVTYSNTDKFDTFSTKKAALAQARYAVKAGNTKSCVHKKLPASGDWHTVQCATKRRLKKRS
jgi:hypothetical protein